jgi:hypothetical protein
MPVRVSRGRPVSETHVVAAITEYLLYRDALVIRINSGAVQPTAAGSRYGYCNENPYVV